MTKTSNGKALVPRSRLLLLDASRFVSFADSFTGWPLTERVRSRPLKRSRLQNRRRPRSAKRTPTAENILREFECDKRTWCISQA